MIDKSDIMAFSREFGLRANVIEKDYVLGWVLAGIFNHAELGKDWVFKGGTCLKKCYFETYRFSEDLDLTLDEILVLDPVVRGVHHPYSDCPVEGIQIKSYCFEEVFAEKIRALAERERPRDLYDVVHLYRHDELTASQNTILSTLQKKCAFKNISVPTMETFRNRPEREEIEVEWENMLAHQLPALPSFKQFWTELPEVMDWLHGIGRKAVMHSISYGREAIDETWRPPSMAQAWHTEAPLEKIRFAAANRLCVNLHYKGNTRLIEPYSLRRSSAGNILLFAVKHKTNEHRSYRVDRIQAAEITNTSFVARYIVELTPAAPISAPTLTRNTGGASLKPTAKRR
ncbi:MAG: nucleotidyl transferase AbiEii/AbiGii toxin family protein [Desulfobacterales bacterium]|nr:nucleotidyl transferase AbiEii/AbiGii toxin family protein [Desulfobacterales bacterium]